MTIHLDEWDVDSVYEHMEDATNEKRLEFLCFRGVLDPATNKKEFIKIGRTKEDLAILLLYTLSERTIMRLYVCA